MKSLEVRNLKKYYGKGNSMVKAVDGVDLSIDIGKFTVVVGTSGSGKSTLLHCIAGLDKPTSGDVLLNGKNIYNLNDEKLSSIRRKEFGFIFQSFNLIPVLNVYDNIVLPVHLDGKKEDKKYIESLIEGMGLKEHIKKFPNELSGGQQQRVAIARALSNRSEFIFADEPTGNLDSKTTEEVMNLLVAAVRQFGHTLVMITHDESIANMADRIVTIKDGKIVKDNIG
ncbi:ABC transporter ATP-binding protein [Peptostreptococcus sp. MV1]|uniref:ABC transporter ATP-binding protein n=1 Tax=Peptostreptococcus sp. MV1 TaxID=1219626 RepID=UPI00050E5B1D|nr:ABC transporter ATP-binding protein [Peptostreptococcus sp. MV1]KGF14499.1 ABC transporter ATP-binding protein [Peptostreptococcus sp. MV1]